MVRSPDALGAAHAGRERSRPVRSAVLARLLPPPARRRRDAERRRDRRVLPDEGPAAPSQRVARRDAIRSATLVAGCRAMSMHVLARTDPHAVRDEVRAGASGLDLHRPRRASRAATGRIPICGSPARSAPTTSSSWIGSTARSCRSTTWTASSRTAGRRRAATATACTASGISRPRRDATCRAPTDRARSGAPRVLEWRTARLTRAVEALGRDRSARIRSRGAVHPQRSAEHEDRRRARRHPVRRLPGPPRPDAAVGERPPREGIPRA